MEDYDNNFFDDLYEVSDKEFREKTIEFLRDVWHNLSYLNDGVSRMQIGTFMHVLKLTATTYALMDTSLLEEDEVFSILNFNRDLYEDDRKMEALKKYAYHYDVDVDDLIEGAEEAFREEKEPGELIPFKLKRSK